MADLNCLVSRAGRNAGLLSVRSVTRQAFAAWKGVVPDRDFTLEPQSRDERVNVTLRCADDKLPAALAALDVELQKFQLIRGTPKSFAEPFPDRPGFQKGNRK
ncbi:MAG TPA: hypothetical protein VFL14_07195 [Xanthomonadales bacterium]|nr:hypothetical protein [Xanthomonadales bacterium]